MARFFRQNIQTLGDPTTPPADPLTGLQPLRRERWESVMRAQDTVCGVGRRVILQTNVGQTAQGSNESQWRFASGEASQDEVVFSAGRARLTSGCFLRASVLYLPSGGVGGTPPTGAFGTLRLRFVWPAEDADEQHDVDIELSPSTVDGFGTLTGSGAAFTELRELVRTITPPVDLSVAAVANRWTVSPTVDVEAFFVGAARVVDFALFEVPYQVCFESDDATWTSHIFSVDDPGGPSNAASPRPRTRRSETSPDGNPRGGTLQTIAVAREQRQRFGPVLLSWDNYQEATSDENSGLEAISRAGSSSALVGLLDGSMSAYDADREGLSVSCGGYARPWRDNNGHALGAADAEAAVPVIFRVLGWTSVGTTDVRLMTSSHDWVTATLGTDVGWYEGWGWLKVGINPSDITVAQVFVAGAGTVSVFAFECEVYPG